MNKDQFTNYIQVSFIDEGKKKELVYALNEGVPIADVQRIFEDFLIEKINEYGDGYEKAAADFNALTVELDKEIESQETTLDKSLDEKLVKVSRTDYDERNKIWDEYYSEIDKLNSSYENRIKSILSKIIINA